MKRQKNIGLRILLGIAAVVCGLAVQVFGAGVGKVIGIADIGHIITLAGFITMGYLIYKWAIK